MPPRSADWVATPVEVELSRDYEPATARVPGIALGSRRLVGPWEPVAADLYRTGVRHARLAGPIELCPTADIGSARSLVLIRELTAHGIAVDWTARCLDGCVGRDLLSHLYPPARIDGTADDAAARRWRESFFLCKCVHRRGPGFIEVRDRRFGSLEMFTIDEPEHLTAITALAEGAPTADVPAGVRHDLGNAHLVTEHAGHLWWLPTRAYRWPFPALVV